MNRRNFIGMLASLVPAAWAARVDLSETPGPLEVTDVVNGQAPTPIRFSTGQPGIKIWKQPARIICEANDWIRQGDLLNMDSSGRVFAAGSGSHNLVAEEDGRPGESILVRIL